MGRSRKRVNLLVKPQNFRQYQFKINKMLTKFFKIMIIKQKELTNIISHGTLKEEFRFQVIIRYGMYVLFVYADALDIHRAHQNPDRARQHNEPSSMRQFLGTGLPVSLS